MRWTHLNGWVLNQIDSCANFLSHFLVSLKTKKKNKHSDNWKLKLFSMETKTKIHRWKCWRLTEHRANVRRIENESIKSLDKKNWVHVRSSIDGIHISIAIHFSILIIQLSQYIKSKNIDHFNESIKEKWQKRSNTSLFIVIKLPFFWLFWIFLCVSTVCFVFVFVL